MSVVNDVLKNLNERHAKELSVQSMPYMYEETQSPQYWLWGLIAVALSASIIMGVKLWSDSHQQFLALTLPAELFFAPKDEPAVKAEISPDIENNKSSLVEPNDTNTIVKPESTVAKKTLQTENIENAVAAVQKGDSQKADELIKQTPRSVQDELKLHMMVKDKPSLVLPYIQKNFPNFMQYPQLIALGAQGEQRSGQHSKAIALYQQLIRMQPKEAKWRAGLGISLEASGDQGNAARMYRLALSMNNLPQALAQFSRARLQSMSQ